MGKLDGKIALVTGGARGQGRSHAGTLAAEGADIVIGDICESFPHTNYPGSTTADLQESVRIIEDLDRRCVAVQTDVSTADGARRLTETAISEFGRIDILVVNHGIVAGGVPTWELEEPQWDEELRVNLKGVWLMCKYVVPHMIAQGGGSIVMTASAAGLMGFSNITHYTAAKHGVVGITRALANETAQLGIRVNAVCPTAVDSPMMDNEWAFSLFGGPGGTREDQLIGTAGLNAQPVALIDMQDVSNMVLFLASDDARYITGLAHLVDAGSYNKFP
ncbi:MAG: mycofactocin-coupled SDR family oxidoreductase [Pseudonocardia sp.]